MANKLVTSRYGVTTRVDFKAWPTPSQVGTTRHPDLTPPHLQGRGQECLAEISGRCCQRKAGSKTIGPVKLHEGCFLGRGYLCDPRSARSYPCLSNPFCPQLPPFTCLQEVSLA